MSLGWDFRIESTLPRTYGKAVICAKCQAQNDPKATSCCRCGADLLPGGRWSERLGYLIGAVVLAAAFIVLARWLGSRAGAPQFCASPAYLLLVALGVVVVGLRMTFGRTPLYERYLKRAQRHLEPFPEQALDDFTEALELAPEKQKPDIRKQRGKLYSKLGRAEPALRDLSAYAAAPRGAVGDGLVSTLTEFDMKGQADMATKAEIEKLQGELVEQGLRKWVGYCKNCKDSVLLTAGRRCVRCGRRARDARLVTPAALEEELTDLDAEHAAKKRRRWGLGAVLAVLLVALLVVASRDILAPQIPRVAAIARSAGATLASYTTRANTATFRDSVFAFEYPADWELVTEEQIPTLLETPLQDLSSSSYEYIGGVYTGGLEDRPGCAKMLIMVVKDPDLHGTLTDEQYEAIRAASSERMGARLISHRKSEVGSMPAAESVHIGVGGQSKWWEVIIVPPWPGQAYLFACCSHPDSYDEFEPVFQRAMETLRIGEPVPTATPGGSYTVQAGDTLNKIANRFGVTLQALVEANDIPDPSLIHVGQVLIIPIPQP
jgi:hypothetical protein